MSMQKFTSRLVGMGRGGRWKCIRIPFDVPKFFGSRARVAVQGRINGFAFRSSIFPDGAGGFFMMVNKAMRAAAQIDEGKPFKVQMEKAGAPPPLKLPKELTAALRADAVAKKAFSGMTCACRKEYAQWIDSAKQCETRERRAAQSIERILKKQRIK